MTMLLASIGDEKLMPLSREGPAPVVTAKNANFGSDQSLAIDRVLRDYEAWMDPSVWKRVEEMNATLTDRKRKPREEIEYCT